jgi:hypothetical protein
MKGITYTLELKPWIQVERLAVVAVLGPRIVVGGSDKVAAVPYRKVVYGDPVFAVAGIGRIGHSG